MTREHIDFLSKPKRLWGVLRTAYYLDRHDRSLLKQHMSKCIILRLKLFRYKNINFVNKDKEKSGPQNECRLGHSL